MSSTDEGEIRDEDHGELKASLHHSQAENGVDRRGRHLDSSPVADSLSRGSDSTRRSLSPRVRKRLHDEGDRYDPKKAYRSRVDLARNSHYGYGRDGDARSVHDDASSRTDYRRSRVTYDDLDRFPSHSSRQPDPYRYRDRNSRDDRRDRDRSRARDQQLRDRARDKNDRQSRRAEQRRRSRSPERSRRNNDRDNYAHREAREHQGRNHRAPPADHWGNPDVKKNIPAFAPGGQEQFRGVAGHEPVASSRHAYHFMDRPPSPEPEPEPEPEEDLVVPEPIDEDAEIERRRKRREMVVARALARDANINGPDSVAPNADAKAAPDTEEMMVDMAQKTDARGNTQEAEATQTNMLLAEKANISVRETNAAVEEEPYGAEALWLNGSRGSAKVATAPTPASPDDEASAHGAAVDIPQAADEAPLEAPLETASQPPADSNRPSGSDALAEDGADLGFDMFSDKFDPNSYAAHMEKRPKMTEQEVGCLEVDDQEGYYKVRIGETIHSRYQVISLLGQGAYARVVRARDLQSETNRVVALKVMRNNAAIRRSGHAEIAIFQKLNRSDPSSKKHIVRLEEWFTYRNHLCVVFENMEMNLRQTVDKRARNVGFNLEAVRRFARQIFIGLDHMRNNNIIHADVKPDNILINETLSMVKICDMGTGFDLDDASTTLTKNPYLISRFYRAPEVILGMDFDHSIDVWSAGCTLYELYMGKVMFPGMTNNHMLMLIMDRRGRVPQRYLKRGEQARKYFDENGVFWFTGPHNPPKEGKAAMTFKQTRDLGPNIDDDVKFMTAAEKYDHDLFKDLLDQCLLVQAERRITPNKALQHPFFSKKAATTTPLAR
ncbi:hypothetical protein CP532_0401 [Ophiocordyceps camponoti-leonardi (nom. inval.)]|nr:hypothetical protein CP532_0401 [Ophiocordyceps camponoti-leonardi (nom. inval.)]